VRWRAGILADSKGGAERTHSKDFAGPWLQGDCSPQNQAAVVSAVSRAMREVES